MCVNTVSWWCWSSILTVLVFGVLVLLVVCVVHYWIEWVKCFKVYTYDMKHKAVRFSQLPNVKKIFNLLTRLFTFIFFLLV